MAARKPKLPSPDRSSWSFGELLLWHFFHNGTRPHGPGMHRVWEVKEAAHAVGRSVRQFWNWIDDSSFPPNTNGIEHALFGNSTQFDAAREELRRKLQARKGKGSASRSRSWAAGPLQIFGNHRKSAGETGAIPSAFGRRALWAGGDQQGEEKPAHGGDRPHLGRQQGPSITDAEYIIIPPEPRRLSASGSGRAGVVGGLAALAVGGLIAVGATYQLWIEIGRRQNAPMSSVTPHDGVRPGGTPPAPTPSPPPAVPNPALPNFPPNPVQAPTLKVVPNLAQPTPEAAKDAAGYDTRRRAEDQEAIERDRETTADRAARLQRERDQHAHNVAELGFQLREYSGMRGEKLDSIHAKSAEDCARACAAASCSGFSLYDNAICYRFTGPVTFTANSDYTAGIRIQSSSAASTLVGTGAALSNPPDLLAQADPPADASGVVRCPNGSFKVTGFTVLCERNLEDGTRLGSSVQTSFMVADINECASKCRPIQRCVGFTYRANDVDRHSCWIYGASPTMREVRGEVVGVRGPVIDQTIGDHPVVDYSK